MGLIEKIESVLLDLRPYIKNDGGDITFVSFNSDTGIVYVTLHGACTNCPMSAYTLKLGIEERLKEQIPEVKEVQEYID